MNLANKKCIPCEGTADPFDQPLIERYLKELDSNWQAIENFKIIKEFRFRQYRQTIDFVNKVAEIAESENHHPVLHVFYGKVVIELWTHAIGGLSENDFILAAKIDKLVEYDT